MNAWRRLLTSRVTGAPNPFFATRQSTPTALIQTSAFSSQATQAPTSVSPEDRPFVHHGDRPRYKNYKKFKSPRKRASKLFDELNKEACEKAKADTPHIWQQDIRVGDSIELKMVSQGGLKPSDKQEVEKIRGVVLGMVKRGLGSSLILRDVVYGLPIERRIPLYSPMIQEATILERNFIFKGRKKVKRAKLYYFRDRNPLLTKVSKY
ncbi:50S ribosomal protein L19 [Nitzschia inconspicua]|uniref:50S ribosomal protein L19 n=1 Tax=Nitzschia inconspicua TaxID=303405 RepID=A0A9K3KDF1_9STRA|nr:50S ribosomal protein L19 [Nitzschia inconspicua]